LPFPGLLGIHTLAAQGIDSMGDSLEMIGAHTSSISAKMIYLQAMRDWPISNLVRHSVDIEMSLIDIDRSISPIGMTT
jgi:hypothetical protein